MSNVGNILKYLGAVTAASAPAKGGESKGSAPAQPAPAQAPAAPPPQAQAPAAPAQAPAPQMTPQQAMQVLVPKLPQGTDNPLVSGDGGKMIDMLFSRFHAATSGDPAKADAILPGISNAKTAAQYLKLGPKGEMHVEMPAEAAKALMDQTAAKAPPELISPDQFAQMFGAKSWATLTAQQAARALPGSEGALGIQPFLRPGPKGETMLLNPWSATYRKTVQDILINSKQRDDRYRSTDEDLANGQQKAKP